MDLVFKLLILHISSSKVWCNNCHAGLSENIECFYSIQIEHLSLHSIYFSSFPLFNLVFSYQAIFLSVLKFCWLNFNSFSFQELRNYISLNLFSFCPIFSEPFRVILIFFEYCYFPFFHFISSFQFRQLRPHFSGLYNFNLIYYELFAADSSIFIPLKGKDLTQLTFFLHHILPFPFA